MPEFKVYYQTLSNEHPSVAWYIIIYITIRAVFLKWLEDQQILWALDVPSPLIWFRVNERDLRLNWCWGNSLCKNIISLILLDDHHQSSKFSLRSSSTFYKQTLENSLRKDFNEANWLWSFIVCCHLTKWKNVFQRSKLEHIKVNETKVRTKIDYYVTGPSYQELSVNRNDCECYSLFFVLIIILLFLRLVITLYRYYV